MTGKDIKIMRIMLDIKAIDFSRLLGISNSKLSLIECGYVKIPDNLSKDIENLFSTLKKGGNGNA